MAVPLRGLPSALRSFAMGKINQGASCSRKNWENTRVALSGEWAREEFRSGKWEIILQTGSERTFHSQEATLFNSSSTHVNEMEGGRMPVQVPGDCYIIIPVLFIHSLSLSAE